MTMLSRAGIRLKPLLVAAAARPLPMQAQAAGTTDGMRYRTLPFSIDDVVPVTLEPMAK
ncbi:hypothetical protein C100_19755 [Sphingobium sp. C100]|uniref:hypothetical protein n=1 Tax=Sphingobium sp. C100 TaxID=1207055 RepID=UPI0003D5A20E|nr:hypothetical protein [Sphingobium sp. C100]ETI60098.1 hypothetical protein C100_19755 [Sphingobium sp. C100]